MTPNTTTNTTTNTTPNTTPNTPPLLPRSSKLKALYKISAENNKVKDNQQRAKRQLEDYCDPCNKKAKTEFQSPPTCK